MTGSRPVLAVGLDANEFNRWYWTVSELRSFLREAGLPAGGLKTVLVERVRRLLAGEEQLKVDVPPRKVRLSPPFHRDTGVVGGVVLSRELREWFEMQADGFQANHVVRGMLSVGGVTLGDVVDRHLATRGERTEVIDSQFEWNRFVRRWTQEHPDGAVDAMRETWRAHRQTRRP